MANSVINTVTWLGFCISGTLTRTAAHFFPCSNSLSAPYEVRCRFTLYAGQNSEPKTVTLEGARISQPDGLWLEDVFPILRQGGGLHGIVIELHGVQPRVDINNSACVLELHSGLSIARFMPERVGDAGLVEARGPLALMQDGFFKSSLVLINFSDSDFTPELYTMKRTESGVQPRELLRVPVVARRGMVEIPIESSFYERVPPVECSFGLARMASISIGKPFPVGLVAYVMYRDANGGQPLAVSGL